MKIDRMSIIDKKGLLAIFDVELSSGITIKGMKLAKGKFGEFVTFPTKEGVDRETGEKTFYPMVYIKDERNKTSFMEQCLSMAKTAYDQKNLGVEPRPPQDDEMPF